MYYRKWKSDVNNDILSGELKYFLDPPGFSAVSSQK